MHNEFTAIADYKKMQFARSLQSDKEGVFMSRIGMAVKIVFFVLFVVMLLGCSKSTTGPEEKVSIAVAQISDQSSDHSVKRIRFMITDGKGNPLPSKRVGFEIIEGDATLSITTGLTSETGEV